MDKKKKMIVLTFKRDYSTNGLKELNSDNLEIR